MSHRITDTSASLIMATTDRSLFSKGHWPVTDIDVDVMLKTITKCQCECEALIIEKRFETGIAGSIQKLQNEQTTTLNIDDDDDTTLFRMDNNFIIQTSNGTWLAKVTKKISTQMEQINNKKTDNITDEKKKAELFIEKEKTSEKVKKSDDEVPPPQPQPSSSSSSVVEEKEIEKDNEEEEDEIEVSRNFSNSEFSQWDIEPPYLWSSEIYENLEELIDNDDEIEIISKESGDLPLTHEKKELKLNSTSVNCDSKMFASIRRRLSENLFSLREDKLAKKEKKKEEKRLKKEEKERKKHASKGGNGSGATGHVGASSGGYASESSSSSASVSDAEIEERHVVISKAIEGPVQSLQRGQELGDLDNIEEQ
uniref:Uncharacterized protein n=1 Tax=Panagrolaimus sp. ES5 TaxID=591445 RepID=A0AC34FEE8_9BILA